MNQRKRITILEESVERVAALEAEIEALMAQLDPETVNPCLRKKSYGISARPEPPR